MYCRAKPSCTVQGMLPIRTLPNSPDESGTSVALSVAHWLAPWCWPIVVVVTLVVLAAFITYLSDHRHLDDLSS